MPSNGAVHLIRQVSAVSATTQNPSLDASKHIYRGYRTQRNKHVHRDTWNPDSQETVLGQQQIWQIQIGTDKLGPMQLVFDVSALTVTNPQTDGPYLADYLGIATWDKIVVEYAGNEVETLYPDECIWKLQHHYDVNEKEIREVELCGNKSVQQRKDLAAEAQHEIICELPFSWTKHPHVYQEIRQLAIRPILRIYWNNLQDFANFDGGINPVCTISNAHIRAHSIWLEAAERDMHTQITESAHGIVRLRTEFKRDYQTSEAIIPAGVTGIFRKELKNFRSVARFLAFTLRPRRILTSGTADPWYVSDYVDYFSYFRLTASGTEAIFENITPKFNKTVMQRQYYSGPYGPNMFFYPWGDNIEDEINADGGYNLNALNNPTLLIDFDGRDLPEDLILTMYVSEYNFNQTCRSNWHKSMTN